MTLDAASLALVAIGGALGGMARFAFAAACDRLLGDGLPYGTLVVNVTGALALGWLAARALDHGDPLWMALAIGVLGSYTTVSALALQVAVLTEERAWGRGALYLAVTLGLGLGAVVLGFVWGRS